MSNDCKHNGRWEVRGGNSLGAGTCLECEKEVNLSELVTNTANRMLVLIDQFQVSKYEAVQYMGGETNRYAGLISEE